MLNFLCVSAKSLEPCPTLCDPMDCSPPGSSVHGILQAKILEWVVMPSSRGSFQPRDRTFISCLLHLQVGSLPLAPPGKPPKLLGFVLFRIHQSGSGRLYHGNKTTPKSQCLNNKVFFIQCFPAGSSGKEPACQCRRHGDVGLIPELRRSLGGGHGNPLWYSCQENPMEKGACRATVHRVTKSQTRLSDLAHTHAFLIHPAHPCELIRSSPPGLLTPRHRLMEPLPAGNIAGCHCKWEGTWQITPKFLKLSKLKCHGTSCSQFLGQHKPIST